MNVTMGNQSSHMFAREPKERAIVQFVRCKTWKRKKRLNGATTLMGNALKNSFCLLFLSTHAQLRLTWWSVSHYTWNSIKRNCVHWCSPTERHHHVSMCLLPYFVWLEIIGGASTRAQNQLEKYLSRYLTLETPRIPKKKIGDKYFWK